MKYGLLLVALSATSSFAMDCYQCASPELQNNWISTGLPILPTVASTLATATKEAFFTPKCSIALTDAILISTTCSTSCLTLAMKTGGEVHYVRGCQSDFLPTSSTGGSLAGSSTASCNLFTNDATGDTVFSDLCLTTAAAADPCNTALENHFAKCLTPGRMSNFKCKKCIDYNEAGECLGDRVTKNSTGSTCTTYYGHMDDEPYVELGATWTIQSISDVNQCVKVTKPVTAGHGLNLGMGYSEPRYFTGEICYCNSDYCNPDNRTQPHDNAAPGKLPILYTLVPMLFTLPLLSLQ